MCTWWGGGGGGGGVYNRQCAKKQTNLAEKTCSYTTFFFPNGCFGNGKDRGWWGVSALGLRAGLDWEAELLQAAPETNFYLTHPFLDLVSGRSSSWQTAHAQVGGVV